MTDAIRPFHRLSGTSTNPVERKGRLLRVITVHFALTGTLLFAGALALAAYLYWLQFNRVDINSSLRIVRAGKIYEAGTQIKLLLLLILIVASLILLRAVKLLSIRSQRGLPLVRAAAIMLLAGFPASWLLWNLEIDPPGLPAGAVHGLLRGSAVLLLLQSTLALWYVFTLLRQGNEIFDKATIPSNAVVRILQPAGIILWTLVVVGLALTLAIMTDLIELPVPRPEPGELLFATTFDAFNDEWDIEIGRDSQQIVAGENGQQLVITYGTLYSGEIVWSTLDRKYNDFDLQVTAQRVSGPVDNQYGVIFRYRDGKNFYLFKISSDGYYSLAKVENEVQEVISDWGMSDSIHQGNGVNQIRVVALGDSFRFYVNGQPIPLCLKGEYANSMWAGPGECRTSELTYVYRDDDFHQGRVALMAGASADLESGDVVIAFDDLLMVGPEKNAMADGQ